ncbi:BtrH N-terminal domain-containing protein [Symbiobacterium terraclitae]|uniref:BtrH N-terminal domain-containing protein n=1 Tax=Symbiobacterium terraclitae TaxID=557451 RepID=UPI0035B5405C
MASATIAYRHIAGSHCESTAMRNWLAHLGIELSEELCLGIGCGLGFTYFRMPGMPHFLVMGRGDDLEFHLADNLGLILEMHKPGGRDPWIPVKELLDAGEPVLVDVDVRHLEYIRRSDSWPEGVGFGGHKMMLVGYDEEAGVAYAHDYAWWDRLTIPLADLAAARLAAGGVTEPEGKWYTLSRPRGLEPDLPRAVRSALAGTVHRLLHPWDKFHGLPAIRGLMEELPLWPRLLGEERARTSARLAYIMFDVAGTGRGCFRRIYGRFLLEAAPLVDEPELEALGRHYLQLAKLWSQLSAMLREAGEGRPCPVFEGKAGSLLAEIARGETEGASRLEEVVSGWI